MDKIEQLRERRGAIRSAGEKVRAQIDRLCDGESFVELSAFSFSKDAFYGEDAKGEGVVTGFATISGYPFYLVAQNYEVSYGGLSKANCAKIAHTLDAAEKQHTPVVYLLHSHGVRVGEGTEALEGISELLLKVTRLKGVVPQFAFISGEVYGSSAVLASLCDAVFMTENSALCLTSPLVLAAQAGKNLKPTEVGGYAALKDAGLPAVLVRGEEEAARRITEITDLIEIPVADAELNDPAPALNVKADAAAILSLIEGGVELGANSYPEAKTVLGRIGGISVAAVVFDRALLGLGDLRKIKSFAEFACCYGLPFVTFVDCTGVKVSLEPESNAVLKEIGEYLSMLDTVDTAKVAVVTGKAVGLGYSLFAAKSAGFDYTFALATAQISLFPTAEGAEIEYAAETGDREKLAALYAEENADPFNAAKGGYLDDIVEPQFLKQYLTAALQTLIK